MEVKTSSRPYYAHLGKHHLLRACHDEVAARVQLALVQAGRVLRGVIAGVAQLAPHHHGHVAQVPARDGGHLADRLGPRTTRPRARHVDLQSTRVGQVAQPGFVGQKRPPVTGNGLSGVILDGAREAGVVEAVRQAALIGPSLHVGELSDDRGHVAVAEPVEGLRLVRHQPLAPQHTSEHVPACIPHTTDICRHHRLLEPFCRPATVTAAANRSGRQPLRLQTGDLITL